MVIITDFTKKDVSEFVEFRHKSKKDSEFLNDISEERAQDIQKEYSGKGKKAYLLKDGDLVVGQLLMEYNSTSKIVKLSLISVLSDYRGQGYARQLLDKVDQYAKQNDAVGVDLYVDKKNNDAIRLYEKSGYKKVKEHGKDRYLYRKTLSKVVKESIISRW